MSIIIELNDSDWVILTLDERAYPEQDPNRDLSPATSQAALDKIIDTASDYAGAVTRNRERLGPSKGHQYGGGTSYKIIETVAMSFAGSAGAAGFLRLCRSLLLEWMRNRRDRSVEITVGSRKIVVKGDNDIDAAVDALNRLEESGNGVASHPDRPPGTSA